MRYNSSTGLRPEQYDEVVWLVSEQVDWDKREGRPHALSLSRSVRVTLMYLRTNLTQEVIAELCGVCQKTISRTIAALIPVVLKVLSRFVPSFASLREALTSKVAVLDGTLLPCWSWKDHHELWSGKHKTTGHNIQVITGLDGTLLWMSDPYPGSVHDAKAFCDLSLSTVLDQTNTLADKGYIGCGVTTPVRRPPNGQLTQAQEEWNTTVSRYRWVVEQANAQIKTWRILHTDYRRPLNTFSEAYETVRALQFFRTSFD